MEQLPVLDVAKKVSRHPEVPSLVGAKMLSSERRMYKENVKRGCIWNIQQKTIAAERTFRRGRLQPHRDHQGSCFCTQFPEVGSALPSHLQLAWRGA